MKILAADIGGTNSRLIYGAYTDKQFQVLAQARYRSTQYQGFMDVVNDFLSANSIRNGIDSACLAVAGPVKDGHASVTNLPWQLDERELSETLAIPRLKLLNDFVALAHGIDSVSDTDSLLIQAGEHQAQHPDAAIVGAGTGLGACHRVWRGGRYQVFSSEAGHAGFAPQNALQCELLNWLSRDNAHVSVEMLLSGQGLGRIYRFLADIKGLAESAELKRAMTDSDPARIISQHALAQDDVLCEQTLTCFVDIYGAAVGDIVLHYYPLQDVYIAGGIAAKIKQLIMGERFLRAFCNKGPMASNMRQLRVKLISDDNVGLYGALNYARLICETG